MRKMSKKSIFLLFLNLNILLLPIYYHISTRLGFPASNFDFISVEQPVNNEKEYLHSIDPYCVNSTRNPINNNNNKLVLQDIKFLYLPENICTKQPDLIIYVFNKVNDMITRSKIRKTWGNKNAFKKIKVFFILGLSSEFYINKIVQKESEKFRDILQGNFLV